MTATPRSAQPRLAELDEAEITTARRRRNQQSGATTHLLEVRMAGGELGCVEIHPGPGGHGAITHAFPIDMPLERVEEIATFAAAGKRARYRTISAATAHRELVVALGLFHAAPVFHRDGLNAWPVNSPLVALALRWLARARSDHHRGAA